MCLIVSKEPNQPISADFITDVFNRNSDGWGVIVWPNGGGPISVHHGMLLPDLIELAATHNEEKLAIHFRYATHGAKDITMTHPFHLTKDIYLMHNGIMPGAPTAEDKSWSDTMRVAELIIKPLLESVENPNEYIRSVGFRHNMEMIAGGGNKLLFADTSGTVLMSNSLWSKTKDDVVVSNQNFSIKEANGVKPEPVKTTYNTHTGKYNNSQYDWDDRWPDATGNYSKAMTPVKTALTYNDYYESAKSASKKKAFYKSLDLFDFAEAHGKVHLKSLLWMLVQHASVNELSSLIHSLYIDYLFKNKPDQYNEYLVPITGGYRLEETKQFKVGKTKKKESVVESCETCEVTEPKGESNATDKEQKTA